jgi:hypothetical protein
MRIALVRHAPVKFPGNRWVRPNGVANAVADYNRAPILPVAVPGELETLAESASVLLASSLYRSIHTAEILARGPVGSIPKRPLSMCYFVLPKVVRSKRLSDSVV